MLKEGQIIWFRHRFNNDRDISEGNHPYLVFKVDRINKIVEVIQICTLHSDKEAFKLAFAGNVKIDLRDPEETALYNVSYAQVDNHFTLEYFSELDTYWPHADYLSPERIKKITDTYYWYRKKRRISSNKIVHITKEEFKRLKLK